MKFLFISLFTSWLAITSISADILIIDDENSYSDMYLDSYNNNYDDSYDQDNFYDDMIYDDDISPDVVFDMIEDNFIINGVESDSGIHFEDGFHTN